MKKTKNRKKDAFRVIVAGALAAGLFAGGFAALNHFIFAAEHDKPVTLPNMISEIQTEDALPPGSEEISYEKAAYQVVAENEDTVSNPNVISAQEAADIGARYLWDVYGIDLGNHTISMLYAKDPSRGIGYWHGAVYKTGDGIENMTYGFSIEAVSGARNSIQRDDSNKSGGKTIPFQQEKAEEYYRENCSEYLEKAKIYAGNQLLAAPLQAEYTGVSAMIAPGYEYEIPAGTETSLVAADGQAGQEIIKVPQGEEIPANCIYVNALITDAGGKQVVVEMDASDQSLSSMINCYKGIDYDSGSVG